MPGSLRVVSINEIRTTTTLSYITSPTTDDIFYVNDAGHQGEFYYDPAPPVGTTDDTGMVLINTPNNRVFRRIIYDHVSVKWYGATGNGSTDDISAIQATVNACIASGIKKVYFPVGNYRITKGIVVQPTSGFLEAMVIEGETASYGGSEGQAKIIIDNANSFALALDKVKGARVRNLTITGKNTALGSLTPYQVQQDPTTNWINGVRNNIHSPHAGIVIDPFNSSVTGTEQYPDFTSFYTSTMGSTDIVIESCTVRYFAVDYCISPTGADKNGDAIKLNNCWGDYAYAAVSTGETQNRSVYVTNFKCWGYTHTIFDTRTYGNGSGTPPEVDGLNVAGGVRFLCELNNWAGSKGLIIRNMHAELLYSLGGNFSSLSGDLVIEDSWVAFTGNAPSQSSSITSIRPPVTIFNGRSLKVVSSTFNQYGSPGGATPLQVAGRIVVFEKCLLDYLPFNTNDRYAQLILRDCSVSGITYPVGDNQIIHDGKPPELASSTILFTSGMKWHTSLGAWKRVKVEDLTSQLSKDVRYVIISTTITLSNIDDSMLTAQFILASSSNDFKVLKQDDILLTSFTDEYGNSKYGVFGKVTSTDPATGTVKIGSIAKGLTPSTTYSLLVYRNEFLIPPLVLGNITSGSNVMTNVLVELGSTNLLATNIPVYSQYFPNGTYIVSYNNTAATITLSNNANATIAGVELLSSNWQSLIWSYPFPNDPAGFGYKAGDIIYNARPDLYPNISYWICTRSGISNSAVIPEFEPVFKSTYNSTYSSNHTADISDYGKLIFLDSTSSAITYTINPVIFKLRTLQLFAKKPGSNTITISPSSGTINGAASYSMSNNESIKIYSDGINSYIIT